MVKVSVLIPTYNSAATIRATLESVLQQTSSPNEILVLDDGSTDDTISIVSSYKPRITVLEQPNRGVASARNALCERATGELVAFLDHDDLWHPRYLEVQSRLFAEHPGSVAFFTGHVNFSGYGQYEWKTAFIEPSLSAEVLSPVAFLVRYNRATGPFASMSYCCVPKRILGELGPEPFCPILSGVDDSYLCMLLPLLGPVIYTHMPLAAYRVTDQAQSANRLKAFSLWVGVFRALEPQYAACHNSVLRKAFRSAFASKRRSYAKILMGAGQIPEAQRQLRDSAKSFGSAVCLGKSLALLLLTCLPACVQPMWPSTHRE